jgi:hypothetical protein
MSTPFPKFLDELLANPPTAGTGVHNWLFKVSRQLHAHMGMVEMENFLQKKVKGCGRYVPIREIRDPALSFLRLDTRRKNGAKLFWTTQ